MIQGITKNGDLKNIMVNEDGTLPVRIEGEEIAVSQTSDIEVTLNSSILTLSQETQTVNIGKKVTMIMIANYSETADVSMTINDNIYQIGSNLALELPMNLVIDSLTLSSTEADTKIQLVVKGVE